MYFWKVVQFDVVTVLYSSDLKVLTSIETLQMSNWPSQIMNDSTPPLQEMHENNPKFQQMICQLQKCQLLKPPPPWKIVMPTL